MKTGMKTLRRILAPVVGLLVAVGQPVAAEQVRDVEATVGGRTVHALCTDGPRQAVLLHGDSGGAESWRPVLEHLSGRVGACAYDRPAADGGERGWFELLDELRQAHAALGFEPGYTLVGFDVGGLYARLFAVDRPWEVGGLVLVDPAHEDWPREARPGMPSDAWSQWMAERRRPNADGVRESELARRARGTRLPDVPVTVITATERESGEGWNERFLAEAARRVHASILRGVRTARHIPATGSGHNVPLEAPDLVAEEIARMVRMTDGAER
jgi:pimeloyl-ACP methyl ester carboxylesterase